MLAGGSTGVTAGAVLGVLGALVPGEIRGAAATACGLAAILIAAVELMGRRVPLIQMDRETPTEWLARGPLSWAIRNGVAIGFGGMTRLGFWLWYVVPIGAFLSGSLLLGALGYGIYSTTRTLSAGGIHRMVTHGRVDPAGVKVLLMSGRARRVASKVLMVVGIATVALTGL